MYHLIWLDGIGDHNRGVLRHENPYQNDTDTRCVLAWERGWDKAQEAQLEREKKS